MIKAAIMGFGTVGSGVFDVFEMNREGIRKRTGNDIEIARILDIRDFSDHPKAHLFTKDFKDILSDSEIKVVAEVMGGLHPAYEFTKDLLSAGKSVVTSNKELVATHGTELMAIAKEKGVSYLFEASVGGGIPIIRPLSICLAANEITEIMGILNGTTNFILNEMIDKGTSFEDALRSAQEKGYAEKNPAADIEGHDACRKIAILASLASGAEVRPDSVPTEGITHVDLKDVGYAEKMGRVIKLIGYTALCNHSVFARVSPMMLPESHPLARVNGVMNAVFVKGNAVGEAMFYGPGAGKLPTASAVAGDMVHAVSRMGENIPIAWSMDETQTILPASETESVFFVRVREKAPLLAAFPDAEEVSLYEGECGFILPLMREGEAEKRLAGVQGVLKKIRME